MTSCCIVVVFCFFVAVNGLQEFLDRAKVSTSPKEARTPSGGAPPHCKVVRVEVCCQRKQNHFSAVKLVVICNKNKICSLCKFG